MIVERYEEQLPHWPASGRTSLRSASARRAIQLGLRGKALRKLNDAWVVSIEDISAFVAANRGAPRSKLVTPRERVYPLSPALERRLLVP